ncbi:MAG: DUF5979 domain-containing protein [Coprobacillaceae bacterium]
MLGVSNKNKKMHLLTKNLLIIVVTFSTFMIAILGWMSGKQGAVNEIHGDGKDVTVYLQKIEKDIDGNITETVIPNAEFYLYEVGNPDVQIGGRYVTNANGKITLSLPEGDYYFVETDPSTNYIFDEDENGDAITKYPFTITADKEETIVVTAYNRRLSGSLVIEKTVTNANGNALSQEQLDLEFEFKISFSDNGTYSYRIDDEEFEVVSGGLIYLKHGQQAIFDKLPSGVVYSVEEIKVRGYVTQSSNHQGTITSDEKTVSFVNTYNPDVENMKGSLTVTKTVSGTSADINKEFSFIVVIDGEEHIFNLKHGESKIFTELPVGVTYSVKEEDYTSDGYNFYSNTICRCYCGR